MCVSSQLQNGDVGRCCSCRRNAIMTCEWFGAARQARPDGARARDLAHHFCCMEHLVACAGVLICPCFREHPRHSDPEVRAARKFFRLWNVKHLVKSAEHAVQYDWVPFRVSKRGRSEDEDEEEEEEEDEEEEETERTPKPLPKNKLLARVLQHRRRPRE